MTFWSSSRREIFMWMVLRRLTVKVAQSVSKLNAFKTGRTTNWKTSLKYLKKVVTNHIISRFLSEIHRVWNVYCPGDGYVGLKEFCLANVQSCQTCWYPIFTAQTSWWGRSRLPSRRSTSDRPPKWSVFQYTKMIGRIAGLILISDLFQLIKLIKKLGRGTWI